MSDAARAAILERLRRARGGVAAGAPHPVPLLAATEDAFAVMERKRYPPAERYPRLKAAMEAVQAEFLETTEEGWPLAVFEFVVSQKIPGLAYGPGTEAGRRLEETWKERGTDAAPLLVPYDRSIETWKRSLFEEVGAGFTTTHGGIAETGGLIVWPSDHEPRLLSLVPPVHLALLDTGSIHDTFFHAMRVERWSEGLPPNALLISGPSKTADIEQTLAYGVHGPKRLVVVAIRR
jgi:L-lactate dehydrogenase complex protein LldG